jgi:hypothetical protein
MSPLLGLLNGAIVLTKAAKMKIYNNFRTAAEAERAAALNASTKGRKVIVTGTGAET